MLASVLSPSARTRVHDDQTTTKPGRQARAAFESDAEAFRHFASLTPLSPNKIDTSLGRINKKTF